jgi:hypothetical protein
MTINFIPQNRHMVEQSNERGMVVKQTGIDSELYAGIKSAPLLVLSCNLPPLCHVCFNETGH